VEGNTQAEMNLPKGDDRQEEEDAWTWPYSVIHKETGVRENLSAQQNKPPPEVQMMGQQKVGDAIKAQAVNMNKEEEMKRGEVQGS